MTRTRQIILLVFLVLQYEGWTQNIIVESFNNTTSVEARTHKRLDSIGTPCALIKVRCLTEDLEFKEAVGSVENKTNEYWVFVPDKSEVLTISSKKICPFEIRYADYGENSVTTNTTYVLTLTVSLAPEKSSFTSHSVPSDFQNGAEAGNADDQLNLGKCYFQGQGIQQNYFIALSWFRQSAEKNLAEAQYYIGICYYFGQGFPKPDYEQAAKWFEKAALQEYADAQYMLGICYEKGQGVKLDLKTARKWYEKAAQNGNKKAIGKLK